MHLLSMLLLAVATNLDNLCVGLAIGLKKQRIPWYTNLVIALLSSAVTLLFCFASSFLVRFGRVPNLLGGALLFLLGLLSFLPPNKKEAADETQTIGLKQTILLGLSLAVNCLPAALAAGMTGLSALPTALLVGGFSFVSVGVGNRLGVSTGVRFKKRRLDYLSGFAMILLGTLETLI